MEDPVEVVAGDALLPGELSVPEDARALIVFAHGSGSSRLSPRNQFVARELQQASLGTLLFDLLTEAEDAEDLRTRELRFDIPLLARRLSGATEWLLGLPEFGGLTIGYFGASTGAAAALIAAADSPGAIGAVVSRGGRPDLAGDALPQVKAPTLLIVGGEDRQVISMNVEALDAMQCERRLEIVPGATHLFEEPGKLEEVSRLSLAWFLQHF
jgi:putative phosphoribosyl transferase